MQHVYCISGLGADERIFCKLDIPGSTFHFIQWIQPETAEDIYAYAGRLKEQIVHDHPSYERISLRVLRIAFSSSMIKMLDIVF